MNYQEAYISTTKYSFGISLKYYVSAMCLYTPLLGFTIAFAMFLQEITESMMPFQHLN